MQKLFAIQSATTHYYSWKLFRNTTYIFLGRIEGKLFLLSSHDFTPLQFSSMELFHLRYFMQLIRPPRWWEPRRSMSWSGISASLTRKLILFGVLKACTHTSLAFSYLVTSHELRRRETLNANSQTSWVFGKVPDPSRNRDPFHLRRISL